MDKSMVDAVLDRVHSRDGLSQSFDFKSATRIVFGAGRVNELGSFAADLQAKRVLLVSDQGVAAVGHTGRGSDALGAAQIDVCIFDAIHENPTTDDVAHGLEVAQEYQPDLIVGLGGGSSMDCAKGINFLFTNGGKMQDYWGIGKATKPMLPMIAVPTTAGTGSEAQSFALISDAKTHAKMACGDAKAAFRMALLDPELTKTMPDSVSAVTGIDAIAHAVETAVTIKRTAMSDVYSRSAWNLLADNFHRVFDSPEDLDARSGMQIGACLAGLAIENSMLGAAHALANPLTAHYGIVHGQAVGLMLPHVVRFNSVEVDPIYASLVSAISKTSNDQSPGQGGVVLSELLSSMLNVAGLPIRLKDCGVDPTRLPQLAADAVKQWTGTFNPRPLDEKNLLQLYTEAM